MSRDPFTAFADEHFTTEQLIDRIRLSAADLRDNVTHSRTLIAESRDVLRRVRIALPRDESVAPSRD